MQQINWAVLGCGHIAKTFMSSVANVDSASVIACAASNGQRALEFAKEHNIETHYASYQEMLNNKNIDIVYIATTHNFHFKHIMLCLKHGKHVFCEKPITLNAQQAKVAFSYAQQNNLMLVEAVWTRFMPAISALKDALKSGIIGNIQCVQANFSLNRELPDNHRLMDKRLAGGALLDLGIYPITIADIVFNKAPVSIESHHTKTHTGVDKNSFYTLKYDSDEIAQLSAGFRLSGSTYANIMGDKGLIQVPFFLGAKEFTVTIEGQAPVRHEYPYDDGDNFKFEIEEVTQTLLNKKMTCDSMPAESTLRVMEIMDAIRRQWGLEYDNESSDIGD
jgi:predicted dehydrogenase